MPAQSATPTVSRHALAAAVVSGSTAFGDCIAGPWLGPAYDVVAGAATAAIAAHAAQTVVRAHGGGVLPLRDLLPAILSRSAANAHQAGLPRMMLRFGCGLDRPLDLVASAASALMKQGAGTLARRAMKGLCDASMPWATLARAARNATSAFLFVRAVEHATAQYCALIT